MGSMYMLLAMLPAEQSTAEFLADPRRASHPGNLAQQRHRARVVVAPAVGGIKRLLDMPHELAATTHRHAMLSSEAARRDCWSGRRARSELPIKRGRASASSATTCFRGRGRSRHVPGDGPVDIAVSPSETTLTGEDLHLVDAAALSGASRPPCIRLYKTTAPSV